MKPGSPKVAARQSGGFRQGFGHFNEEHLEQAASTSVVQQKQLTQQTTQTSQPTAGKAGQPGSTPPTTVQAATNLPPREVSTFKDELIDRPVEDIVQGVKKIFSLHDVLNINSGDTPEEQEKKKILNQRFEKLTAEQQEVAKKRFQEEMQKKKETEEEEQRKQTKEEEAQDVTLAPPSSPRKGPIGLFGSKKQKAQQILQRDRQSLGRVAGAN